MIEEKNWDKTKKGFQRSPYENYLREKREARDWLFEHSDDFEEVCANANIEPNSMRRFAKHVYGVYILKGSKKARALIPENL